MPQVITHDGLAILLERPPADAPRRAPVLLVHGIFVGASSLAQAQHALTARGHPTAAVQLRGRFGSRPVRDIGKVRIADFVRDVVDAARHVQQLWRQRPVLLGHSMGGLLVQKAAETGVAAAAVLVCTAPPFGISTLTPRLVKRMAPYVPAMLLSRRVIMSREDADEVALNRVEPERRAAVYARDFIHDSGRALRDMAIGVRVDPRQVVCPVLCVTGSDDRFVSPAAVQKVAGRYKATFLEYPRHGHVLFEEPGWERPVGDIAEWIDAVAQRGATAWLAGTSEALGGT